ncbi:hypothetical protein ACGFMM_07090 [Streptomyces sp. NPDC048604]|uniref:hypothetical protein n=1 Tax=Streptomyces sp. NPDC048604 TaxID=3365578 RepID=UPI0037238D2C
MYGHGHPPPQQQRPGQGALIALRVLFVALPLLSCGFLAWAPLLRTALLTRRVRDWALFGLFLAVSAGLIVWAGLTGDEEPGTLESLIAVGTMMGLVVGSISYYLVIDIQHFARPAVPPAPPAMTGGYGYPHTAVTVPSPTPGYPQPQPQPQPPVPQPQSPAPQPAAPQPRIDQVRAELDELSDLLRKEEGK